MYDLKSRVECKDFTVGKLVEFLKGLKPDTKVLFNGDNYGCIHVEENDSCISFDSDDLDYLYDEKNED